MKKLAMTVLTGVTGFALAGSAQAAGSDMLKIDPGVQIWTLLTFLVMLGLLARFVFKPIAAALDKRAEAIKSSLAEAEKARAEVKKMSDEAKKVTDAARLEANRILDETRQAAETVRKEIIARANAEAAELVKRAQEGIEQQKQKALGELRQTVAELSVQVAEAVIARRLDDALHKQLADQFIANLGKK
jgi:F-type H+-transporting ATPase subunit b